MLVVVMAIGRFTLEQLKKRELVRIVFTNCLMRYGQSDYAFYCVCFFTDSVGFLLFFGAGFGLYGCDALQKRAVLC